MAESKNKKHINVTRDGAVATVTIDRGDERNALSIALIRELTEIAQSFADDLQTQAIILTSQGAFTAGVDLKDPAFEQMRGVGLLERRRFLRLGPDLCDAWQNVEQTTICAIENYCIGGGVALAVACDFRILGQSAVMRLPEIPLGMNMSWHAVPRLASLIGPARTKRFVIFGEKISAQESLAWGLADEVTPVGGAAAAARRWAEKIGKLPPNAVRMTKHSVNAAANALHQTASFMDLDQYALATTSEDFREGIAAFYEKRSPKFSGR
jgi:enoyl-CoA hydratase/carnithine racemase